MRVQISHTSATHHATLLRTGRKGKTIMLDPRARTIAWHGMAIATVAFYNQMRTIAGLSQEAESGKCKVEDIGAQKKHQISYLNNDFPYSTLSTLSTPSIRVKMKGTCKVTWKGPNNINTLLVPSIHATRTLPSAIVPAACTPC